MTSNFLYLSNYQELQDFDLSPTDYDVRDQARLVHVSHAVIERSWLDWRRPQSDSFDQSYFSPFKLAIVAS